MRDLYSAATAPVLGHCHHVDGDIHRGFRRAALGPHDHFLLLNITATGSRSLFHLGQPGGRPGAGAFHDPSGHNRTMEVRHDLVWLAAFALACAAIFHSTFLMGLPVFFLCLLVGALAWDGGFVNIVPYSTELYPVHLAGQGTGLCQACSGLGKLIGPAILALVAGAGTVLSPKATSASILPGFLLLSAFCVAGGVALSFLRYETHGKPMVVETEDAVRSRA